jgi:bifunctional ADP-heptose synthase (sugar kinase/adenylyltransferase)
MSLFLNDGSVHHIPVFKKVEVADVSGAGDTVAGVMILGILSGLDYPNSAYLANIAANIVVRKLGTATLTREELSNEIKSSNS